LSVLLKIPVKLFLFILSKGSILRVFLLIKNLNIKFMNKSELKAIAAKYFNLVPATITPTENFAGAKLIDGTEITTDGQGGFEVGQTAHVMTEAGESVLAPTGEHELEDGTVLVIDGEGVITGVKTKDESGTGSLEEMEEVVLPAEGIQEAVIAAIAEIVMPELESMKKKMAEMQDAIKIMHSAPASIPTVEKKFSKQTIEVKPNYNQKRYAMALKNFTKN